MTATSLAVALLLVIAIITAIVVDASTNDKIDNNNNKQHQPQRFTKQNPGAGAATATSISKKEAADRKKFHDVQSKLKSGKKHYNYTKTRPCEFPQNQGKPFCNPALDLDDRVRDFVSRIPASCVPWMFANTVLPCNTTEFAFGFYQWWSEALHGVALSPGTSFDGPIKAATQFPEPSLLGSTYDRKIWARFAEIVGTESRAFHNSHQAGLTFYSFANLNLAPDPRWGRLQESAAMESPQVQAVYAATVFPVGQGVRFANGTLTNSTFLRVVYCAKHFSNYHYENWGTSKNHVLDRHNRDVTGMTPHDQSAYYFPAFEAAVAPVSLGGGGVGSLMCSYNSVNGVPSCANKLYLTNFVRGAWQGHLYLTSDCGAVEDVYDRHHFAATPEDAVRDVLQAGVDIDCGAFVTAFLDSTLDTGELSLGTVRTRLEKQARILMRLGFFDPLETNPWSKLGPADVNTPAAKQAAYDAAVDGIVLLEHFEPKSAFPLNSSSSSNKNKFVSNKIGLFGPNANANLTMLGSYYGIPSSISTILTALQQRAVNVVFSEGCDVDGFAAWQLEDPCSLIEQNPDMDAIIVALGLNQLVESEGHDRDSIDLPGLQKLMLRRIVTCAMAAANATKRATPIPIVVLYMSGGSVDMSFVNELVATHGKNNTGIAALLWAGYAGERGGDAIVDIILGNVAPSGRLSHPVYPANYVNQMSALDSRILPSDDGLYPGRFYTHYKDPLRYVVGHGLSTTTFTVTTIAVSNLVLPPESEIGSRPSTLVTVMNFVFNVTNTGSRASKLTLLLLVDPPVTPRLVRPAIADFGKTSKALAPGESETITLHLPLFSVIDPARQVFRGGRYSWSLQDSQANSGTFDVPQS